MVQKEILAGAAALLVLGGGIFYFANQGATPAVTESESQTANVETATTATGNGLFSGTFADLMNREGSYECAFSEEVSGSKSEGVVYVAGKKIRGNFTSTVGTETIRSSMIHDGTDMYMWSEAMPQGIKMKAAAAEGDVGAPMAGEMFNPNIAMNYDCKEWTTDSAWFVVPPNVEFMSL